MISIHSTDSTVKLIPYTYRRINRINSREKLQPALSILLGESDRETVNAMELYFPGSDRPCAPLKIDPKRRTHHKKFKFPQRAGASPHALSYPALSPKELAGTHKARASGELNQIRSAKRSSLGSAFRARKRDSAATFPITLPRVQRVIRPASRISRYTRVAETSRRAGPKQKRRRRREREREREREGEREGDKRGDGGALTLVPRKQVAIYARSLRLCAPSAL